MIRRLLPAAIIAAIGAATWLWFDQSDHWLRAYIKLLVIASTLALCSLALVFALLHTWKTRLGGTVFVLLALAGAGLVLKANFGAPGGSAGTGLPEFRWPWEPSDESPTERFVATTEVPVATGRSSFRRFLGPAGDGFVPGITLATDWDASPPELLWRRPVGLGWSGFVVAEGLAVTQEQDGDEERVTCYQLDTGEPVWSHGEDVRFSEAMGSDGPRSTPTIDGIYVYAMGATGLLNCLELSTGEPLWRRDVLADHGNLTWGKSNAPLIHGDLVIVTGGDNGPSVLAFDKMTGEPVWDAEGAPASYASPVVATLGGLEQIVAVNSTEVAGYDPATGACHWKFEWPGSFPKAAQPLPVGDDRVLVSASYAVKSALLEISGGRELSVVWESSKFPTKFSSGLVRGGYAYGLGEGRMVCIDLADGSRVWRGDSYGYGQNLLVGDIILVQAERGQVALVAADPEEFRELARLDALSGKTWNPPALAGEFLLVRNASEAACYRLPLEAK